MGLSECDLSLDALPAKSEPFQSIRTHSLTTGIVAQELLQSFMGTDVRDILGRMLGLDETSLTHFLGYFAAMHDVGKLAPRFAASIAKSCANRQQLGDALKRHGLDPVDEPKGRVGHEDSGNIIMQQMWEKAGEDWASTYFFASILGAHHQGKKSYSHCDELLKNSPWEVYRHQLHHAMSEFFVWNQTPQLPIVEKEDEAFVGAVLNGLVILSDWIASGETFNDAQRIVEMGNMEIIRNMAADFVKKSGLKAEPVDWSASFSEMWKSLHGQPRPLQEAVEQVMHECPRPQMVMIEAPMGEGKTEAALFAATQVARGAKNGFYVALPTAATANQMVDRVREFLKDQGIPEKVRLLHSKAWLSQTPRFDLADSDADEAERWLDPLRRGLLGPYAVGTVDQAMMAALFIKYGVLRLLGLSGKALIIDEVHAYDVYMETIILRLLEWCRALNVPVVLLSATLPPEKKQQLLRPFTSVETSMGQEYPAITVVDESGEVRVVHVPETAMKNEVDVHVLPILNDTDQIAEKALNLVENGGRLCVLVNKVEKAQDVYNAIKARWDSPELHIFHARFPAVRRQKLEEKCLSVFGKDKAEGSKREGRNKKKSILVATQVVEQSLDIDFDVMMTAIAPIDLVLQRMGRVHRHRDADILRPAAHRTPTLYVMTPGNGKYDEVYPECLTQNSARILGSVDRIKVPSDIPQLVARGYSSSDVPPEQLEGWAEHAMDNLICRQESNKGVLNEPAKGFQPVNEDPWVDDMENHNFISARTRLETVPSVTIALLEPDLYETVKQAIVEGKARSRVTTQLAQQVMQNSVSVPASRMKGFVPEIEGCGRLAGIQIYPAEGGVYTNDEGKTIRYDSELGVVWD